MYLVAEVEQLGIVQSILCEGGNYLKLLCS